MFFPNYTNNETYTGPLSEMNELSMDVREFPKYAHYIKSSSSNSGKKNKKVAASQASQNESINDVNQLPPYTMQEFFVTNTRMVYTDGVHSLGFAAPPYTSSIGLQNIVRLVIGPDIGYYLPDEQPATAGRSRDGKKTNESNDEEDDKSNKNYKRNKDDEDDYGEEKDDDDDNDNDNEYDDDENDEIDDDENEEVENRPVTKRGFVHSDYTRKYSPQEAHARVLAMPVYNGNTTTTILQSNKSERYYQLTMLLESSSRIYVLPAATIPCYTVIQPWTHLCRLLQLNPVRPPPRYVVPIEDVPEWYHLKQLYSVKYVVHLPPNVSLMNRRDPVIKEGSLETITTIFAYDNSDADVQYNNPYGCYNKHEDYDGDTNTQSLGKGVESHVEMYYNMKRQCLPCLRVKSVMPQNMLARIMLYFLRDVQTKFPSTGLETIVNRKYTLTLFADNKRTFDHMISKQFDEPRSSPRRPINQVRRIFAIELLRRTCVCLSHLIKVNALLPVAERIFGDKLPALLYLDFFRKRWTKIRPRVSQFFDEYMHNSEVYFSHEDEVVYNATRDVLHEIHGLWKPVSRAIVSNCQTLVDDVTRSVYCLTDENTCTRMLDHCSHTVHSDIPVFFLSGRPYDVEYIATVLSRAKGDFDSLLSMHVSLYERFRDEAWSRRLERSRSKPLPLGSRDLLSRIEPERIQKYVDYTDKYVVGSKTVPKSCVQANNMKCAMQNVQYYDGDLWMNGELILENVAVYLPNFFFVNKNLVDLVLDELVGRSLDVTTQKLDH